MRHELWDSLELSTAKLRIARRRLCGGFDASREWFTTRGLDLSDAEWTAYARWLDAVPGSTVAESHASADGTERLVVRFADGALAETVVMPVGAVCVSSQVGCAVGCRFCASGVHGVQRNLSALEILEQLIHARRRRKIDRVVFMGMGEPSHNLPAVLEAIALIREYGLIGTRRQTVSTVGSVRAFETLAAADARPCLALSLHTTDPDLRRELLPRAPHQDPLEELVRAAGRYGDAIGMPVQFEWTLLAGVNDGDDEVERVVELLRGVRGYVNYIVWNRVDGLPFEAPTRERAVELVRALRRRGVLATVRNSTGGDANAACGQLRRRVGSYAHGR